MAVKYFMGSGEVLSCWKFTEHGKNLLAERQKNKQGKFGAWINVSRGGMKMKPRITVICIFRPVSDIRKCFSIAVVHFAKLIPLKMGGKLLSI